MTSLELPRSRASIRLEKDLHFDPFFARHGKAIEQALRAFRPEVIHITGPSELGMAGAFFARQLGVPLAASWHTNLHEYAARRSAWLDRMFKGAGRQIEGATLAAISRFYQLARVLFAPNQELCNLLEQRTGCPCHLMQRGVDTALFSPARRQHRDTDTLILGYVGRLSVEKNVTLLPAIQRELRTRGVRNTRFRIIGHGDQEDALRRELPDAEFPGVLRGAALAGAFAGMDLFVFPSETDTFGNVVLEALSSGVPAVVTRGGGPKFIVKDGATGVVTDSVDFAGTIAGLVGDPARLTSMSTAARAHAMTCSWDAVFARVYQAYDSTLHPTVG